MTSYSNDPIGTAVPFQRWRKLMARHGGKGSEADRAAATAATTAEEDEAGFPTEETVEEELPPAAPSRLFNPRWNVEQGYFNEKAVMTVEGELPPESSQLTRITFTVFALKDGNVERLESMDAHLKDGKALAEAVLWIPQVRDEKGGLAQECEYTFTAKHRDSPEVESGKLTGKPRSNGLPPDTAVPPTTIDVVLLGEGNLPRAEEKYVLTDADGKVYQGVTSKEGRIRVEGAAPGEATVAFPGLEMLAGTETRVAAGAGGKSSFYLRIQMDPEEAKKLEEKFILTSEDGSFTQTRTVEDDLILGDNFIDLRFTGLPIDLAYSLNIEAKGRPPYCMFKNVPFLKLNGFVG